MHTPSRNRSTLKSGDYFGEMALMLDETRHANCIAVGGVVKCLTLDRVKFDILLGPVLELLTKRMRIRILQSVPLLSRLAEPKLIKLASVMRVQSFVDGQYIIRQGEEVCGTPNQHIHASAKHTTQQQIPNSLHFGFFVATSPPVHFRLPSNTSHLVFSFVKFV